jgi:ribonuclease HII
MWTHYILGIDEAGRGPWAGPVVIAGWCLEVGKADKIYTTLIGLTDSKALRESERETLFEKIRLMPHHIVEQSAEVIDTIWIREANRQGMEQIIEYFLWNIQADDSLTVWIDGCDNYEFHLSESPSYTFARKSNQKKGKPSSETRERIHIEYMIAGDLHLPIVSGASILAKVYRDRRMCEYSVMYSEYGFENHKWYGTRKHEDAMINYGITPIHRKTYAPVKRLISEHCSV